MGTGLAAPDLKHSFVAPAHPPAPLLRLQIITLPLDLLSGSARLVIAAKEVENVYRQGYPNEEAAPVVRFRHGTRIIDRCGRGGASGRGCTRRLNPIECAVCVRGEICGIHAGKQRWIFSHVLCRGACEARRNFVYRSERKARPEAAGSCTEHRSSQPSIPRLSGLILYQTARK